MGNPDSEMIAGGPSDGHGHGHGHGRRSTETVDGRRCTADMPGASTVSRRRRNDLDVDRCALELYRAIGRIAAQFPRGESDLRSQMKRAGRSVPFNIGEGVGKRGRSRAAAYRIALGEAKELIVALDCVEIDQLASIDEVSAAQDLADRVCAMLTKLIRSTEGQARVIDGVQASTDAPPTAPRADYEPQP